MIDLLQIITVIQKEKKEQKKHPPHVPYIELQYKIMQHVELELSKLAEEGKIKITHTINDQAVYIKDG